MTLLHSVRLKVIEIDACTLHEDWHNTFFKGDFMQGLNKIFLLGYLGNDPQLLSAKNGHFYTSLNVATHRPHLNKETSTESNSTTDWHYVRVWGKLAETCSKYLVRGQPVLVEGYLTYYSKADEATGETKYQTGINALKVEFLPRAKPAEAQIAAES